ncbi:NYN domain-containing protein [Xanthomonas phaseoli]|uniref:NYN domain-containing protein n=1 Tax=Xanthomonas phaseoli TaxID=1985254 RepID=UPI00267C6304
MTSDSDFSYLCRKLRERGATVCIVGEPKTPDALRNACDQFFEWDRTAQEEATAKRQADEPEASKRACAEFCVTVVWVTAEEVAPRTGS